MTKLYKYQKQGVKALEAFDGRVLLADEMGLGKTIQALWYYKRNKTSPVVIICPASLKYNWAREAAVHIGQRAEILEGTKPPKRKVFKKNSFVIINYEIVGAWLDYLLEMDPQLVILDECQYIKNRAAKRTRYVRQLCKKVPHVLALSGTPLTNRPAELWPILNVVRPDIFKSFMSFVMEYCSARRMPWGWQFKGAKNLDKLHKLLTENCMVRRRKADVLTDLPAKSRHVVPVPIQNRKEYDEAEDDLITWLSKYSKAKASRASRAQRLVKMGYLKRLAGKLKLKSITDWIDAFLEESDGKLVVFAIHKNIIAQLKERYKNCVVVTGSTSSKKRQQAVDRFQRDKKTRLFIGNLQAAGVGLTLTASSTVLFAELGWTPGEHVQGEDRVHRIGQTNAAQIYYLIGVDTIEERLSKILQEKQAVLSATLDGGDVVEQLDIFNQLQEELIDENEHDR
jgi:SWI/SNF-related matrix-associated actin-dependent regulator 1 of chromatin subfamily A